MNTQPTVTRLSVVSPSYLTGNSLSSFLVSLVTANLARVLHADTPATPAPSSTGPSASIPEWLTGESLDTFLASLHPEIEQRGRSLYYRVPGISVDVQDIIQEGMISAWQATRHYDAAKVVNERSFRGYCIKKARGAMLNYVTRINRLPATSLEGYLEVDTDNGPIHREIADTPIQHRQASLSQRRRILAALRKLTRQEQIVILAHFRIDDKRGRCPSPDTVQRRLNLSDSAYYNTRARAVKKLAHIL